MSSLLELRMENTSFETYLQRITSTGDTFSTEFYLYNLQQQKLTRSLEEILTRLRLFILCDLSSKASSTDEILMQMPLKSFVVKSFTVHLLCVSTL